MLPVVNPIKAMIQLYEQYAKTKHTSSFVVTCFAGRVAG
jgi:hypothetical protein